MPTVPSSTNGVDYEPDIAWKENLRKRIEDGLRSMVADAKQNHANGLNMAPDTEARIRLEAEYEEAMKTIKGIASDQFKLELDRERNQRRWTAGVPMTPAWTQYFHQEQQNIMNSIKRSNRTASESPTEERRPTIPRPSNEPSAFAPSTSVRPAENFFVSPDVRSTMFGDRDNSGSFRINHHASVRVRPSWSENWVASEIVDEPEELLRSPPPQRTRVPSTDRPSQQPSFVSPDIRWDSSLGRSSRFTHSSEPRSAPRAPPEIWKPAISPAEDTLLPTRPYNLGRRAYPTSMRSTGSGARIRPSITETITGAGLRSDDRHRPIDNPRKPPPYYDYRVQSFPRDSYPYRNQQIPPPPPQDPRPMSSRSSYGGGNDRDYGSQYSTPHGPHGPKPPPYLPQRESRPISRQVSFTRQLLHLDLDDDNDERDTIDRGGRGGDRDRDRETHWDRDYDRDRDRDGGGRDIHSSGADLRRSSITTYPYSASRHSSSSSHSKPSTTITPGGGSSSRPPLQDYDVHEDWDGVPGPRYNINRDPPPPPQRRLSESTRPGPGLSRQSSYVRLPPRDDPVRRYGDNDEYSSRQFSTSTAAGGSGGIPIPRHIPSLDEQPPTTTSQQPAWRDWAAEGIRHPNYNYHQQQARSSQSPNAESTSPPPRRPTTTTTTTSPHPLPPPQESYPRSSPRDDCPPPSFGGRGMNLSRQRGGGNNIAAPDEYDSADEDTDSEEREEEDEEEDRDIDDDDDSSGEGIEAKKLRDLEARRQRLEGNRRVAYPYSASRYSSSSSYSKPSTTITPGGASGSSSRPPLQNYDVHEDWGGVPGPRYNIYRDPPPPQRHLSDSTRPGPGLSRQSSHVRLPPQDDPDRRYSGDNDGYSSSRHFSTSTVGGGGGIPIPRHISSLDEQLFTSHQRQQPAWREWATEANRHPNYYYHQQQARFPPLSNVESSFPLPLRFTSMTTTLHPLPPPPPPQQSYPRNSLRDDRLPPPSFSGREMDWWRQRNSIANSAEYDSADDDEDTDSEEREEEEEEEEEDNEDNEDDDDEDDEEESSGEWIEL